MVNEPHIEPAALAKLTMPTLVICGTRDMIQESHTRTIANKQPDVFNRAVEEFLETNGI